MKPITDKLTFAEFWNYCLEFRNDYITVFNKQEMVLSFEKWLNVMKHTEIEKNT